MVRPEAVATLCEMAEAVLASNGVEPPHVLPGGDARWPGRSADAPRPNQRLPKRARNSPRPFQWAPRRGRDTSLAAHGRGIPTTPRFDAYTLRIAIWLVKQPIERGAATGQNVAMGKKLAKRSGRPPIHPSLKRKAFAVPMNAVERRRYEKGAARDGQRDLATWIRSVLDAYCTKPGQT
jgi:hypothetical protein